MPPTTPTQRQGVQYLQGRRLLDQTLALLLLVGLSPLLLVLLVLVRVTSPGPALYRQQRVGRYGRLFTVLKLRSMRRDAERGTGAVWSPPGDLRVTRIGRFLRRSHLDELPQLLNVLTGDMALIGPRPERPEIVRVLVGEIPDYLERSQVLPGITGLAQVVLPADVDLDSVRRKTRLDLQYLDSANRVLDLHILLRTLIRLFGMERFLTKVSPCPWVWRGHALWSETPASHSPPCKGTPGATRARSGSPPLV